ncbi:MAG: aspartate/glutamate racemase family protein [Caldiserica bacterium]|jgi:allantoin racemase|nr:aspartate/glutamate racemase family protein [Caldisericota bacterium]
MKRKILFIDPVPGPIEPNFKSYLELGKASETELVIASIESGPEHLEYRFYETLVLRDILSLSVKAEKDGFDGVVIGCFYDPGLYEAREITKDLVVVAPGEASMHIASTLGNSFSIIVGRDKWVPRVLENLHRYGLKEKLASIKALGLGVNDFHKDPERTMKLLMKAAEEAKTKDRAEVLILGCTMQYGFYNELQENLKIPVIDVSLAALKYAEFFIDLRKQFSWKTSKACAYESPPMEEMLKWGIYPP